jgi:acyl-CoA thioester hydrolase
MADRKIVETTLRVRYAETDAMGIVHHANYLIWFEVGRGEYFRALGQDYVGWEQDGYLLPVTEARVRYHSPARFGDLISVRTWLERVRSRSIKLGYDVRDAATGQCLVKGWSAHICADRGGKARRLPEAMLRALEMP